MYHLLNKDQIIAEFSVDPVTEAINIEERLVKLPEWRLKALEKEMHDVIDAILEKDALRTKQIAVKGQNRE